jgi:ribonuclease P protein component
MASAPARRLWVAVPSCALAALAVVPSCRPEPDQLASAVTPAVPIRRLTRRSEFLAVNGGVRVPMPAFVLLVQPRGDNFPDAGYGVTATKRLGGAVVRNRVKRRFRAIIRDLFPAHALPGADHVLIGRPDALTLDHARLTADVGKALVKAGRRLAERDRAKMAGDSV